MKRALEGLKEWAERRRAISWAIRYISADDAFRGCLRRGGSGPGGKMEILKVLSFVILLPIFLTGCGNILYVSTLAWHQGFVLSHCVPIQEVLENSSRNPEEKEKIHFIQEVKRYGEERLGLKKTKSYTTFFEVEGSILNVVTASEKDRLQLRTWRFPVVGEVTYKSFFTREDALKEQQLLEREGLDTFVQQAGAYSTLGYLKDPIFPSMLKWRRPMLANLILHEMTHATIYFKNETSLNEQVATFIGNRGAVGFLSETYGPGSDEVLEALHLQEDDLLFSRWVDRACERLSSLYAKEISREEKLKEREEIFRSLREGFKETKTQLKTEMYGEVEKVTLNNAVLLAYRQYLHHLEAMEALYEEKGRDLRRVIDYFKEKLASKERLSSRSKR